jgi:hypothetical protein
MEAAGDDARDCGWLAVARAAPLPISARLAIAFIESDWELIGKLLDVSPLDAVPPLEIASAVVTRLCPRPPPGVAAGFIVYLRPRRSEGRHPAAASQQAVGKVLLEQNFLK